MANNYKINNNKQRAFSDIIKMGEEYRARLDIINREIQKLDKTKLNYSIQELQSKDMIDDSKMEENKRILEEAN